MYDPMYDTLEEALTNKQEEPVKEITFTLMRRLISLITTWLYLNFLDRKSTTTNPRTRFTKWLSFIRWTITNVDMLSINTNFAILAGIGKKLLANLRICKSEENLLDAATLVDMYYSATNSFKKQICSARRYYLQKKDDDCKIALNAFMKIAFIKRLNRKRTHPKRKQNFLSRHFMANLRDNLLPKLIHIFSENNLGRPMHKKNIIPPL